MKGEQGIHIVQNIKRWRGGNLPICTHRHLLLDPDFQCGEGCAQDPHLRQVLFSSLLCSGQISDYCKLLQIFTNIANIAHYCKLKLTFAQLLHMILHFLQIIANYCKLKQLDFALRLLSLQIIAHIADFANYCKVLQIIVNNCTLTLTFALRLLSLHTASLVFSQTARCVPLLVKSRDFIMMDISIQIYNNYIKYISK